MKGEMKKAPDYWDIPTINNMAKERIGYPTQKPEALLERRPDAVLLLTWNFADEIIRQQRAYLAGGGEFIVPVPHLHTIGKEVCV